MGLPPVHSCRSLCFLNGVKVLGPLSSAVLASSGLINVERILLTRVEWFSKGKELLKRVSEVNHV